MSKLGLFKECQGLYETLKQKKIMVISVPQDAAYYLDQANNLTCE